MASLGQASRMPPAANPIEFRPHLSVRSPLNPSVFELELPAGYKINEEAPTAYRVEFPTGDGNGQHGPVLRQKFVNVGIGLYPIRVRPLSGPLLDHVADRDVLAVAHARECRSQ